MTRPSFAGIQLALLFAAGSAVTGIAAARDGLTYSRGIAPILQEKCVACHNPDNPDSHNALYVSTPPDE